MRRRRFITRTIRPDGTVRIYGVTMACRRDASEFAGDRPIFGVYMDEHGAPTGAALWGHPDDEWPGRYCHRESWGPGYFLWEWWHPVVLGTEQDTA